MAATVLLTATMSWPFAAQLAGAFASVGAQVEALCPAGSVLAASRHPSRRHRLHMLAPAASLRAALRIARPDLVIACDDLAAELVWRVRGGVRLDSRVDFLSAAAGAGAAVAETMAIDDDAELEDALRRFGLPLVVKCDHSWGGDGVVIAATRQEARAAFRRLRKNSRLRHLARAVHRRRAHFLNRALFPVCPRISAQRYVEGHAATSSLACWQGELVAAHHFDVTHSSEATGPASVIRAIPCPQMAASARAVAKAFHLSGLFGLDYIRDAGGAVHLLEINPRATPTSHLALGQDLAAALLLAAGLPARPRPPVTDREAIALFPGEWLRDPASPWLARAFHDVPWDDPAVVGACARLAPRPAAKILLETVPDMLTTKAGLLGGPQAAGGRRR